MDETYIALGIVALFTCAINIPLGIWRSGLAKFSLLWFFAIHASVPLILILRSMLNISSVYALPIIGCAILGQLMGSGIHSHYARIKA